MSSSKFSSPFFQKSPLRGAYSSGADGMVTVSYDDVHQKFQDGIAENVAKSYSKKNDPCSDPNTVQYTEDVAMTMLAYQDHKDTAINLRVSIKQSARC